MTTRIRTAVAAVAILGATGAVMPQGDAANSCPLAKACTFVKEFERSSSNPNKVSFLERVLYSLVEANDHGAQHRAPESI